MTAVIVHARLLSCEVDCWLIEWAQNFLRRYMQTEKVLVIQWYSGHINRRIEMPEFYFLLFKSII